MVLLIGRGRRQGQNANDFQTSGLTSLHPGARDSRATGSSATKSSDILESDIFAPPKDSDESGDEDSRSSKTPTNRVSSSAPVPNTAYDDGDDDAADTPEVLKRPRTQTYFGKKAYSMATKHSGNLGKPTTKRKFSYQTGKTRPRFQAVPPPLSSAPMDFENGFVHVPAAPEQPATDSQPESETFFAPPKLASKPLNSKDNAFTDQLETLDLPTMVSRKVHLSIKNDIDQCLEQGTKRARTKNAKRRAGGSVFNEPPIKKSAVVPETIFMLPPTSSTLDLSQESLPDHEIFIDPHNKIDDSDSEDKRILSPSSRSGARSSNKSTCSAYSSRCQVCQRPIDKSLMDNLKERYKIPIDGRLTVRQQELLHIRHSRTDAELLWKERHYPVIDWRGIAKRLGQYETHVSSIIESRISSYHRLKLGQKLPSRGRKTTTLAEEIITGQTASKVLGYYGTRGQRAIGDWLVSRYSTRLKQKSKESDIQLAGGIGGFIQKVLIPEMVQCLMVEDIQRDSAMQSGAQARADSIINTSNNEIKDLSGVEPDLYKDVRAAAAEAGVFETVIELGKEEIPWLARFIAFESAECGALLSEEIADVVPMDTSEDQRT